MSDERKPELPEVETDRPVPKRQDNLAPPEGPAPPPEPPPGPKPPGVDE
jgi:hypothetical protein